MNGAHLLQTLTEIGCPIKEDVSPESVDWMFTDDSALPFLEWFCCNLDPNTNCLSEMDLHEYAELEQTDNDNLLDGEELLTAHKNLKRFDLDEASQAELQQEIAQLTDELNSAEICMDKSIQMTNSLNIQQANLTHRITQTSSLKNSVDEYQKQQSKVCRSNDERFDEELSLLATSSTTLVDMYGKSLNFGDSSIVTDRLFLSQQPTAMHEHAEETLKQEMSAFTRKQFFSGISTIACGDNNSNYQVLDVSADHVDRNITRTGGNGDHTSELSRLRQAYHHCELSRIRIVATEEKLSAELSFSQQRLKDFQLPGHCGDINALRKKLQDTQKQYSRICGENSTLMETKIKKLVEHCANSQSVRILQGDYDLKIERQNYFIGNQDKVINQLINQQSHFDFLAMAYAIEIQNHHRVYQLLFAVTMDLKQSLQTMQRRLDFMMSPDLNSGDVKTVVNSDDRMTHSLYKIVETDDSNHNGALYLTFKTLSDSADKLAENLSVAESCETYFRQDGNEKLTKLEELLKSYESRLYSESSTVKGIPQLSPQQLVEVMKSLESTVEKFETALLDITKEIKNKRASLEKDPLLQDERKLFLRFFTDPEKLKKSINDLSARIEARSISNT